MFLETTLGSGQRSTKGAKCNHGTTTGRLLPASKIFFLREALLAEEMPA